MFQDKFSDPGTKNKRIFFILFIGLFFILFIPFVLMLLWNSVMPEVTHFTRINYCQALSLFVLCRLLFGGFRFGNGGQRSFGGGREWKQKWQNMSDEERVQFKENWKRRCEEKKN